MKIPVDIYGRTFEESCYPRWGIWPSKEAWQDAVREHKAYVERKSEEEKRPMSDTEHWTTPSGYDLQRVYGTLDHDPEGRPIIGYAYALVMDHPQAGIYYRFDLSETEFEALRAISKVR